MSPENIDRQAFYTRLDQQRELLSVGQILYELPTAVGSFIKEVQVYQGAYKEAPEDIKPFIDTGPAKLVSFWAYAAVSGRNLSQVRREGLLIPAALLYATCATQDDILDTFRKNHEEVSAREAFWYKNPPQFHKPTDMFRRVIDLIDRNNNLHQDQKLYIKRRIAHAYKNYTSAEDELGREVGNPNVDLHKIHMLRAESFGLIAKAVTAVLNGKNCESSNSQQIEDRMAWFILAAEILDSEIDREEDRQYTMTLPLASDAADKNKEQKRDSTVEKLLNIYLSGIDSARVNSFILTMRYLYPRLQGLLRIMELTRGSKHFTRFTLKTDRENKS